MKFVSAIKKLLGHGKLVPTGIIVHATAGASGQSSVSWLSQIGLGYHFIIERNGDIIVGVPKEQKAYHAGKSVGWAGKNCNDYTIGVSFANLDDGKDPITAAQYNALTELIIDLRKKVPTLTKISTHYWVSPGRKTDPVLFRPTGTHYVGLEIWRG
jgi:N-acetyl-anhydromuramyl-L-alanine amidase AmpD